MKFYRKIEDSVFCFWSIIVLRIKTTFITIRSELTLWFPSKLEKEQHGVLQLTLIDSLK